MKHTRTPRIVLALVVCLSALLMTAATGYGVPKANAYLAPTPTATPTCPPDYEWTSWGGCRPIPKPCPGGTIDVNGNGNNDGGNDCQALDTIVTPSICGAWPSPGPLGPEGSVACALPWSLGGQSVVLLGATGCLVVCKLNSATNDLSGFTACDSVTPLQRQIQEVSHAWSEARQVQIETKG
jgi:hypothetical protein